MIKIIAMDMDGTLLNRDSVISERNLRSLIEVQEKGVKLVLASGRSKATLLPYAKQLRMDVFGGKLIGANGVSITNPKNGDTQVLSQCSISSQIRVFEFAKKYQLEYMSVLDQKIYHYLPENLLSLKLDYARSKNLDVTMPLTAGTFDFVHDQRSKYPFINPIFNSDDLVEDCNKMVLSTTIELMRNVEETILITLGEKYQCSKTGSAWMELTPVGTTKGNALKKILDDYNISPVEMICFGDAENDLSMLKMTPYSVAMGNAMKVVKDSCNHISSSNDEDGIAKMLEKFKDDILTTRK